MTKQQKFLITVVFILTPYILYLVSRYWYADTLYAKAKNLNKSKDPSKAEKLLLKAVKISPSEPYYHLELSESYTKLGFADLAISESQKTVDLSPKNVNLVRSQFSVYLRLSFAEPKYLLPAAKTLEEAIKMAPTDAKLFYNLGLTYIRLGQKDRAIEVLKKAIEMKPNYNEAKLALEYLLTK